MTHFILAAAVAAIAVMTPGSTPASQGQQAPGARASEARAIDVYASVVDDKGAPVTGLTVADFVVREDGVLREVLKVAPATEPMQIALVVDDSQAATGAIPLLRDAMTDFIDKLAGKGEMSIVTVGERPTVLQGYTPSAETLKKAVGRLFARPGSGAYLTEGIRDVSRGLAKRDGPRPVIVVLTIEAVEFSTLYYDQVLKDLYASGATLHVIGLGTRSPAMNDEMRNRNMVIVEGSDRTGGRNDALLTPQAFPDKMAQLATELLNQYVVTYARPDTLVPPDRARGTVKRPGLIVRAATRASAPAAAK